MRRLGRRIFERLLGPRAWKHWVKPHLFRQEQRPYDAAAYFSSWHCAFRDHFDDRITISPNYRPFQSRFHYNALENSIIKYFAERSAPNEPELLDIGSGAGHWLDFYRAVFGARRCVGVEIAPPTAEFLINKYGGEPSVSIAVADVSSPEFSIEGTFDIVNAIGVMFHIVDDAAWERAIRQLASRLKRDGTMIVGGEFGYATANVQFHATDHFSDGKALIRKLDPSKPALVNKRIRSYRRWASAAKRAGLKIERRDVVQQARHVCTPENNLLYLTRL